MMFDYDTVGWWGYAGMGIGMVLFWSFIVVGIVGLIRISTANGRSDSSRMAYRIPPEQLLAERFARGDIDEAEYRQGLATLRSNHMRQP
jgi:putative membrane protein